MRQYFIRRVFDTIVALFGIITFDFFLFRLMPGDAVSLLARSAQLTPDMTRYLEKLYGLNQPLWQQFFAYIKNLFTLRLGISYTTRLQVLPLVLEKMGNSVILLTGSTVLAIIIAVSLGLISGWSRGTKTDLGLLVFSLTTWCIPTFWLAMVAAGAFAGTLPLSGMIDPLLEHASFFSYLLDVGRHLILPTMVLTVLYIGGNFLLTRSELVSVLAQDYITTAKAKGLKPVRIVLRHALRNASLPLLSNVALSLAFIIGGALQTEIIFSWPGIGRLFYEAALARDYPVLQGAFYVLSLGVLLANFLADIIYKYIDPRIRY